MQQRACSAQQFLCRALIAFCCWVVRGWWRATRVASRRIAQHLFLSASSFITRFHTRVHSRSVSSFHASPVYSINVLARWSANQEALRPAGGFCLDMPHTLLLFCVFNWGGLGPAVSGVWINLVGVSAGPRPCVLCRQRDEQLAGLQHGWALETGLLGWLCACPAVRVGMW